MPRMTIREYFGYVFHPSRITALADEADAAVGLALLHHNLREQAETALEQERARNSEGNRGLLR